MQMSRLEQQQAIAAITAFLRQSGRPDVAQQHLLGTGATGGIEEKMREHFGLPYAVAVCNATSGLFAAQLALGLQDSEIVTSAFSYGASLSGALFLQNRCIFADVDHHMNVCSQSIRNHLSSRTKAILAVDFNGVPSDMEALRRISDECGLWYIADAAQSFGARRNGRPASSSADVLITSFTLGKTLFAGEGAVILTRHADLYQRLIWLTQHPCRQRREIGLHSFNEFGFNFRIHPLAAVWANAAFETSLQKLRTVQRFWLRVLETLESSGLTENCDYHLQTVCPSFFRTVVRCRPGVRVQDIQKHLFTRKIHVAAEEMTFVPIYKNDYLKSAVEADAISASHCPTADNMGTMNTVVLRRTASKEEL